MWRSIYFDKARKITTGHTVPTSYLEKGLIMGKPILFTVLCLFLCCLACSDSDSNAGNSDACECIVTYDIEVDCQEDQTPFGESGGENGIRNIFPDSTMLFFYESDMFLSREMIKRADLIDYANDNRDKESIGGKLRSVHDFYLCFVEGFLDDDGNVLDSIAGESIMTGIKGQRWSFIATGTLLQNYDLVQWSTCHELGHQLAILQHLCRLDLYGNPELSPRHSDESCLMSATAPYPVCTNESVLSDMHFCDSCVKKLCR